MSNDSLQHINKFKLADDGPWTLSSISAFLLLHCSTAISSKATMPSRCHVIGLSPPSDDLWEREYLRTNVTLVGAEDAVRWRDEYSLAPDTEQQNNCWTLLLSCVSDDSVASEDVVAAVEAALAKRRPTTTTSSHYFCELWVSAPAPLPLRPNGGYDCIRSSASSNGSDDMQQASATLREYGMVVQPNILRRTNQQQQLPALRRIVDAAMARAEAALARHRPAIQMGRDSFVFREMASRDLERFDLRLDGAPGAREFVEQYLLGLGTDEAAAAVEEHLPHSSPTSTIPALLNEILGGSSYPDEIDFDISVVYSRPGACAQKWHADGAHQAGAPDAGWEEEDGWKSSTLAPPYALCLFLPLIDLNAAVGFTQFWPGSHRHRDLMGFGPAAEVVGATFDGICKAGDGIWYDYRLWHRGMANDISSETIRPVVQVVFKKKWYIERANYGEESIVKEGADGDASRQSSNDNCAG